MKQVIKDLVLRRSLRLKKAAGVLSLTVVLVGVVVIFGWIADANALKHMSAQWVSMKVNTAICFILAGATVFLFGRGVLHPVTKSITAITIPALFLVAAISFLEHILEFDAGIDELFFRDPVEILGNVRPGLMSVQTSLSFIMVSIALFHKRFLDIDTTLHQVLLIVPAFVAVFFLTGYLFDARLLISASYKTPMAIHTSVSFLILVFAALFLNPHEGVLKTFTSESSGGKVFRNTLPVVTVLILVLGWLRLKGELAGIYDSAMGVTIFAVAVIAVVAVILFANAIALDRSEASLKSTETNLHALFENSSQGFLLTDSSFNILEYNPAVEEFVIMAIGKPIEKNKNLLNDFVPPERREGYSKMYAKVLAGEKISYETVYEKEKGSIAFSVRISPVTGADGTITGCCIVAEEITERREAAIKLQNLNEELEQRVRERTAQYEVANKELGAFSYSVSHDLRAPLRAVGGYARMLEEDYRDRLDENGRRLLRVIRESAERMGVLIDELLALSRLGKREVRKTFVDMTTLVNTCHAELQAGTPHHARLVVHPLHPAPADPILIAQVWTNLLSNAVKYSSKVREPLIEISSVEMNGEVIYQVRDNGAGFEMEYASKLFGIFQRLHSSEEFEGTGVGLAITHRIIEKHNGKIWADGKVDQGATFWFSLPNRADDLSGAGGNDSDHPSRKSTDIPDAVTK